MIFDLPVALNQLETRDMTYLQSSSRGKVNKIFHLPVASNQLEGQLCELPQVVSRHLAMLVVVGQRHGRNLPKIKYSE